MCPRSLTEGQPYILLSPFPGELCFDMAGAATSKSGLACSTLHGTGTPCRKPVALPCAGLQLLCSEHEASPFTSATLRPLLPMDRGRLAVGEILLLSSLTGVQ